MYLPLLLQSKIIKHLYENGDMWPMEVSLVSKHFFKIVKEIVGSSIRFDFGFSSYIQLSNGSLSARYEDTDIFNNFCKAIVDGRIYKSQYFLYSQLEELTVNYEQIYCSEEDIINDLDRLLSSDQWEEWNKTKELPIEVKMLHYEGFSSEISSFLQNDKATQYISEFSLYVNFELEELGYIKLPPNLKRLIVSTEDDLESLPSDVTQIELFLERLKKCKQLEHFSFQSDVLVRYLSQYSAMLFHYIKSLDNLKSLEVKGIKNATLEYGDGFPEWNDQIINHLKDHKQITEFSFCLAFKSALLILQQNQLLEYLFSQDCVVQRIRASSMLSNEIPKIHRNISYLFVGIEMSVGHFTIEGKIYSRTEEQSLLAKQEIQQQVKVAINEFSHIDHLVICDSMQEGRDDFNQINADSNHTKSKNYFYALDYLEFVEQLRVTRESANQKFDIHLSNEMQKYWIVLGCPNTEYKYLYSKDEEEEDNEKSENVKVEEKEENTKIGDNKDTINDNIISNKEVDQDQSKDIAEKDNICDSDDNDSDNDEYDSDYSRNDDEDYEDYFDDSAFEDSEYEKDDEESFISVKIESNINN
ncbi:hypothetical protein PPL_04895 [Heterostelium album PN500]|uniref:Uncharacterized protein n=1 Tax=Heterostelium pallidum (strain ATCC 26659 / Pp 5 / PN500) TaxID=670386 RepID=D3B8V2_HETP5|nr:hypothetical protein PPL_04895 [Heterostelium album PN500]EFA82470.1 hypothetical protein PPL_04895 [Heterostelium album PN500]|eukprot:XP_020434587.1 hypothetical protein PPL_04895 [Heterostelium album PN500]